MIPLVRKLTWTWQLTSTTHSLQQCALCSINISWEVLIIVSFHHTTLFSYLIWFLRLYWAKVKSWKPSLFFTEFWWNGNVQIATVCTVTLSLICLVHTCTYIQFHSRLEFHIWNSKLSSAETVLKVRLEELEQSTINTIDMCAAVHVYIQ